MKPVIIIAIAFVYLLNGISDVDGFIAQYYSWDENWNDDGVLKSILINPSDIVFDSEDNFYVSDNDPNNGRILKFTIDGDLIKKIPIELPFNMVIDSEDNLYVVNRINSDYVIDKMTKEGEIITRYDKKSGYTIGAGNSLAVDSKNNLFIKSVNNLQKISPTGKVLEVWNLSDIPEIGDIGSGSITINSNDEIYFYGQVGLGKITKVDSKINFILDWENERSGAMVVAYDGTVFVNSGAMHSQVLLFSSEGSPLGGLGAGGVNSLTFRNFIGIALDSNENVYVVDKLNKLVTKFANLSQFNQLDKTESDDVQHTNSDEIICPQGAETVNGECPDKPVIQSTIEPEDCTTYECQQQRMNFEIIQNQGNPIQQPTYDPSMNPNNLFKDASENCEIKFSVSTPDGWVNEEICDMFMGWSNVIQFYPKNFVEKYTPIVSIKQIEVNDDIINYVKFTPDHVLIDDISLSLDYNLPIVEKRIERTSDYILFEMTGSRTASELEGNTYHHYDVHEAQIIKLFYSGNGYKFDYFSIVKDHEITKEGFKKIINSFNSDPPTSKDIICGKGTIEKNGQCVVDTKSSKGGGCLIATATYGTELTPQVQLLREIRDNSLLTTTSGIQFMNTFNDFYYSFSPIIADYERENPVFKEMVKVAITPMISSLSILNYVDMDSESEVLGYGISLIILNGMMYVGLPIAGIIVIRKRF